MERTLSGVGETCRDSRIGWQLNETKDGFTVRVFDLQSNATLRELQFGKEYRWSRTYTVGRPYCHAGWRRVLNWVQRQEAVAMARRSKRTVCLTVILAGVFLDEALSDTPADSPPKDSPISVIYDNNPNHLWNRLYAALVVRTGPDGKVYGDDRLEPLLWEQSLYLLRGKQAERAVTVLEEFVREKGEALVVDPVKRAILQRDLWLVANWLIGRSKADSEKLLRLIAQVVSRLALTPEQIVRLPDNYAMAVASKKFAAEFDQDKPERAYLPTNLFHRDGPWICVGRTDGRTAPAHLGGPLHLLPNSEKNPFTNSTFLVFLKLPAGREAGLAFLKQLARQPKPIFLVMTGEDGRATSAPNRDLPALPVGSELALVRRAC